MRESTVAARYAKALHLTTEKRAQTAQALPDLQGVLEVMRPGSRIGNFFASPEVRMTDKRAALRRAFDGRALPTVIVFIDLLLRKHRLAELPAITAQFEALVEKSQGIQRAEVTSAVPLLPAELETLHREIEQLTGKHVRLTTEVDDSLIGGALVRIGDRVIDRSVRTLLEAIGKQLHETSV